MHQKTHVAVAQTYPLFEVILGVSTSWVSARTAARAVEVQNGDSVLGTRAKEADGTVRPITPEERKEILRLAEETATE